MYRFESDCGYQFMKRICKRCNVELERGQAIESRDPNVRVAVSLFDKGQLINCLKCPVCGHSESLHLTWEEQQKLAEEELTEEESERLRASYRASGDVICETCGQKYYQHPPYIPSGKTNQGVPWLRELCNGNLVKL